MTLPSQLTDLRLACSLLSVTALEWRQRRRPGACSRSGEPRRPM